MVAHLRNTAATREVTVVMKWADFSSVIWWPDIPDLRAAAATVE
jgi:hypothetical protein